MASIYLKKNRTNQGYTQIRARAYLNRAVAIKVVVSLNTAHTSDEMAKEYADERIT